MKVRGGGGRRWLQVRCDSILLIFTLYLLQSSLSSLSLYFNGLLSLLFSQLRNRVAAVIEDSKSRAVGEGIEGELVEGGASELLLELAGKQGDGEGANHQRSQHHGDDVLGCGQFVGIGGFFKVLKSGHRVASICHQ